MFLCTAGHLTSTYLITNTLYTLLQSTERLQQVRDYYQDNNETLIYTLLDEIVINSPPIKTIYRIIGDKVDILRSSMNQCKSSRVFNNHHDDNDNNNNRIPQSTDFIKFDLSAFSHPSCSCPALSLSNASSLFGLGPHRCIGKHLAYQEAKV